MCVTRTDNYPKPTTGEMYNDRTKRKFRAYDLYVAEE